MFRKRRRPTPEFGIPSPFSPVTGEHADLQVEGIHPYCAMMQVAAADTYQDYVICRGFDPRIRKYIDYEAGNSDKPGISVAKPFGKRVAGEYTVGEIHPAVLPIQGTEDYTPPSPANVHWRLGQNPGTAGAVGTLAGLAGHPPSLTSAITAMTDHNGLYVNWMLISGGTDLDHRRFICLTSPGINQGDSGVVWTPQGSETALNSSRTRVWQWSPGILARVDDAWHIVEAYSSTKIKGIADNRIDHPSPGFAVDVTSYDGIYPFTTAVVWLLPGYYIPADYGIEAHWHEPDKKWYAIGCCGATTTTTTTSTTTTTTTTTGAPTTTTTGAPTTTTTGGPTTTTTGGPTTTTTAGATTTTTTAAPDRADCVKMTLDMSNATCANCEKLDGIWYLPILRDVPEDYQYQLEVYAVETVDGVVFVPADDDVEGVHVATLVADVGDVGGGIVELKGQIQLNNELEMCSNNEWFHYTKEEATPFDYKNFDVGGADWTRESSRAEEELVCTYGVEHRLQGSDCPREAADCCEVDATITDDNCANCDKISGRHYLPLLSTTPTQALWSLGVYDGATQIALLTARVKNEGATESVDFWIALQNEPEMCNDNEVVHYYKDVPSPVDASDFDESGSDWSIDLPPAPRSCSYPTYLGAKSSDCTPPTTTSTTAEPTTTTTTTAAPTTTTTTTTTTAGPTTTTVEPTTTTTSEGTTTAGPTTTTAEPTTTTTSEGTTTAEPTTTTTTAAPTTTTTTTTTAGPTTTTAEPTTTTTSEGTTTSEPTTTTTTTTTTAAPTTTSSTTTTTTTAGPTTTTAEPPPTTTTTTSEGTTTAAPTTTTTTTAAPTTTTTAAPTTTTSSTTTTTTAGPTSTTEAPTTTSTTTTIAGTTTAGPTTTTAAPTTTTTSEGTTTVAPTTTTTAAPTTTTLWPLCNGCQEGTQPDTLKVNLSLGNDGCSECSNTYSGSFTVTRDGTCTYKYNWPESVGDGAGGNINVVIGASQSLQCDDAGDDCPNYFIQVHFHKGSGGGDCQNVCDYYWIACYYSAIECDNINTGSMAFCTDQSEAPGCDCTAISCSVENT